MAPPGPAKELKRNPRFLSRVWPEEDVEIKGRRKRRREARKRRESEAAHPRSFYEHLARSPAQLLVNFSDYYTVVK